MSRFDIKTSILVLTAFLATGCSNTESENVRTQGFYVTYVVSSDNGSNATATATLQVGGPTGTYLELNAGDSVTVNGQSMSKQELLGIITYSRSVTYSVGGTYEFVLSREGEDDYVSSVTLTEAVTIASPINGANHTKNTNLAVTWNAGSNSNDTIDVTLDVDTTNSSEDSYGDAQSTDTIYTFTSTETNVQNGSGDIAATVRVERERTGTMDSALDGRIRSVQRAEAAITLKD